MENSILYKADQVGHANLIMGGSDKNKFVPNLNMSFHDDEFYINLNRKDKIVKDELATLTSGKVKQKIDSETDEYYLDGNDRLKWDIVFDLLPKKMDIVFDMEYSDGIEFFYQDELTAEEIANGDIRPDDIVGSYAVYCNKANNKYKTGKLCHIPRPFVIDAENNQEWCVLDIKNKKLTITLPETFMENAIYPVRLDPTFGYITEGGTGSTASGIRINNNDYIMSVDGTATKVYVYSMVTSAGTYTLNAGYYDDNAGAPSTAHKVAMTISNESVGWNNGNISGDLVNGSEYYPALAKNSSSIRVYYDSVGTRWTNSTIYDLDDNPSGLASGAYTFSVYVEYTAASGGIPLPVYLNQLRQQGIL
jgi:hypothetical protein